ncbi:hypothetical protein PsorP6_011517 [Peronosclerospora sorghi]|uniref:Uncharacterized protein n=1 Tax=Peronosclerospora sorghi TaxID=230839 RepID=A0ACC0WMH2_9STRA|nr:hypothetical protein PsorP6_011517 [Peronosclerospora sorghi]
MDGCVNERVIQKLSVQPPSAFLVVNYFKVNWETDGTQEADPLALTPPRTGATVIRASVSRSEFTALFASAPQSSANPPYLPCVPSSNPSTEATATAPAALQASVSRRTSDQTAQAPQKTWDSPPAAPASASNATQSIPDFDELTARFERLRQRQDRHDPKNLSFTF